MSDAKSAANTWAEGTPLSAVPYELTVVMKSFVEEAYVLAPERVTSCLPSYFPATSIAGPGVSTT